MMKIKFTIISFLLILFGNTVLHAQEQSYIDSLVKVLKSTPDDTSKLIILSDLSDNAADGEWQKYNEQLGILSQKLRKSSQADIVHCATVYYGTYLNNKGFESAEQADYVKTFEYYSACEKIYREINNLTGLALIYSSTGAVYDRIGETDMALRSYEKALAMQINSTNHKDLTATLNNIAVIYSKKNNVEKQYEYYHRAYLIARKHNLKNQITTIVTKGLGDVFYKRKDFINAIKYFEEGIELAQEIGNKKGYVVNLIGLAKIEFDQGKIKEALEHASIAMQVANEVDMPVNISESANLLGLIYQRKGNYRKALEYFEIEKVAVERVKKIENQKSAIRHQYQSEFDRKEFTAKAEQEKKDAISIKELQRQKLLRNTFVGGFAIVLLFAAVFFRQRNKINKAKKRSDELLLNILPSEVAEELKLKGEVDAQQFDEVSVLFTDFVNFTGISESLSPKDLVAEIHQYFKAFDAIAEKHGLEKIKTIGDAYLAVCGVPNPTIEHAERTILAALDIIEFTKERKKNGGLFEIRVGVHSGPLVAGVVGVKKFAYDIWGDTVNTAARMEQNSEAGRINISQKTFDLIGQKFECKYRGELTAKNKGQLKMYFVEQLNGK